MYYCDYTLGGNECVREKGVKLAKYGTKFFLIMYLRPTKFQEKT